MPQVLPIKSATRHAGQTFECFVAEPEKMTWPSPKRTIGNKHADGAIRTAQRGTKDASGKLSWPIRLDPGSSICELALIHGKPFADSVPKGIRGPDCVSYFGVIPNTLRAADGKG